MAQEGQPEKNIAWPSCPTHGSGGSFQKKQCLTLLPHTWITGVIWTHKTMCSYFYIARDTCVRDHIKSYRALRQVDEKAWSKSESRYNKRELVHLTGIF